ncbi:MULTISPECIES: sensor histidine kinase [unclassified Streptomyces]|uniref:sensor histidine kinase n=1 Tax=unclassified Streptomyces TaxID=2593676 RepID=UPI002E20B638|nr:histidine kinase [Streptomyces sp. NBC_01023]
MGSERRERITDLALWALICAPVVLRTVVDGGSTWWRPVAGVAVLGAGVGLSRRWPLTALLIAVALGLTVTPKLWTPEYAAALAVFGYLAGRRTALARPALHAFAGTAAAGLLITRAAHLDLWAWLVELSTLAFGVMVPWLLGRYVRQYAQLVDTGWLLAGRLEREQAVAADRARLLERSRIAGDMHDSLGHDLSLIAVRAAALEVDPSLTGRQQSAAGELRAAAGEATARLRDIIGVLRENDGAAPVSPPGETVAEQVERARRSGMDVELTGEGAAGGLAPMTGRAVHRTVQESLTNAAGHAPGAPVAVRLVRSDSALTVTVTSAAGPPGLPSGPPAETGWADAAELPGGPGGGTGLVGLDERIRLAGGTLRHGPLPGGGFEVSATLPPAPGAPPAAPGEKSSSAQELARARQQVRRRLKQAVWVPLAATAALGVLIGAVGLATRYGTVLDRAQYDLIRVGDPAGPVGARLPRHAMGGAPAGAPPVPAGAECRYYRAGPFSGLPAYRLCFSGGTLTSKAVLR